MSRITPQSAVLATLCLHAAAAVALPLNYPNWTTNSSVAGTTAVTVPYIERVEQLATNGHGGAGIGNQWGGHQTRVTHHRDGTVRVLYVINNPAGGIYWRLMRRTAGATADWAQEAFGASYDDVVLMRDPVSDRAHVLAWPNSVPTVYTSPSYGGAAVPGKWALAGPNTRHYAGVGIGPDGTLCLKASVELPTTVPTTNTRTDYTCGKFSGATNAWSWNAQVQKSIGLRHAYDYVFPGGFGVANQMVSTSQRDLHALADGLTALSFPYTFNGVRQYATGTSEAYSWKQADPVKPVAAPTTTTVAPQSRQTDSFIDGTNRVWSTYYLYDPTNSKPSGLYLTIANSAGTVLYTKKLATPGYGYARFFEDAKGRRWLLWTNQGAAATQFWLYRVTDTGGTAPVVTLGTPTDLSRALAPYSIQGAALLAVQRGGQSVGNVVDGSFAACEGTYVAGKSLVCYPSGTAQQRLVHFRLRLPD